MNVELGRSAQLNARCLYSTPISQSWASPPSVESAVSFTPTTEGNHWLVQACGNELGTARDSALVFAFASIRQRARVDRPDSIPGKKKIKPVYYRASDGPDLHRDTDGSIAEMIRYDALDMAAQTGMILAVDTYNGEYDVLSVQSRYTTAEIVAVGANQVSFMLAELRQLGLAQEGDSTVKYVFIAEVPSNYACGSGILDGPAAGLYLQECTGLLVGFWRLAFSHEVGHTMGAVCRTAPNFDQNSQFHSTVLGDRMRPAPGLDIDKARVDYWGPNAPPGCDISRKGWYKPAPANMIAAGKTMAALRVAPAPVFEFREVLERWPQKP